jgi:hypothetical protein
MQGNSILNSLNGDSKTKSQLTTPLTQFSLTAIKQPESKKFSHENLTEKAKGLLIGANSNKSNDQ